MNSKDRVYASGRLPIHFSNVRFTCEFLLCFSLTWEFQVWKYFTVDLTKSRLKNKICIQFKPDPQLIHSWVTCENMRLFCTGANTIIDLRCYKLFHCRAKNHISPGEPYFTIFYHNNFQRVEAKFSHFFYLLFTSEKYLFIWCLSDVYIGKIPFWDI